MIEYAAGASIVVVAEADGDQLEVYTPFTACVRKYKVVPWLVGPQPKLVAVVEAAPQ